MEPSKLLEKTQRKLNISLSEHLEKGIDLLLSIIDEDSNLILDIYQLRGKYNEIEQDSIQGIIKYDDKMFYSNKIRVGLLAIIERLKISDFNADIDYWNEEEKALLVLKDSSNSNSNTPTSSPANAPASAETTEPTSYTFEDLPLFKAQHKPLLTYFPVLYREISAIVFRGSSEDDVITELLNSLHSNLKNLQQYKTVLSALETSKDKIRLLDKSEYYQLLLNKFIDFKSTINTKTLNTLAPKLMELNKLSILLQRELTPG